MDSKKIKKIIVSTLIVIVVVSILTGLIIQVYSVNYNYRKYEFKFTTNSIDVQLGSSSKIPLSLTSDGTVDYSDFTYTSTDTSIVRVDDEGNITPINKGKAMVVVKAKKSNQSEMLNVNVVLFKSAVKVDDIIVDKRNLNLIVGESISVNAKIVPSNSSFTALVWSSSNTSVASVVGGVISAKMEGNCVIYVQCGDIKKEIPVFVSKN